MRIAIATSSASERNIVARINSRFPKMLRVEKIHPNETSLLAVEPLENAVHGVGLAGVAAGLPLRVAVRIKHLRICWRFNLPFECSALIVNPHGGVAEPTALFGVGNGVLFLEIKRFNAFALEGFPESFSVGSDVNDSRRAHGEDLF